MKHKITFRKTNEVCLKLNGSFDIKVLESDDFVGLEYDCASEDSCEVREENNFVYVEADKAGVEWNSEVKDSVSKLDFKNGFLNFLESALPLARTILNKKKSQKVDLYVFLKKNQTKRLDIDADNANIEFENVELENLRINIDNCHFKSNQNFCVPKVVVRADNLDAVLSFGKRSPFWDISSDNASIRINREGKFDGQIRVSGDNRDVTGRTNGNPKIGLCEIRADNADVVVKE